MQIYESGFKGVTDELLRQYLAQRAVVRAFQTIWACKSLDVKRAMQGKTPRYLKKVSLVEPGFCDALDLQVGADNRPLLKAAGQSNAELALAQIRNAFECYGTEEGYKETLCLREQEDLKNDPNFGCKLGRALWPEKPLPKKLTFRSDSEMVLYYWLPLRIWSKTADEARCDLIEAGKLEGHTVPKASAFKQSLADTKRRTLIAL